MPDPAPPSANTSPRIEAVSSTASAFATTTRTPLGPSRAIRPCGARISSSARRGSLDTGSSRTLISGFTTSSVKRTVRPSAPRSRRTSASGRPAYFTRGAAAAVVPSRSWPWRDGPAAAYKQAATAQAAAKDRRPTRIHSTAPTSRLATARRVSSNRVGPRRIISGDERLLARIPAQAKDSGRPCISHSRGRPTRCRRA